MSEPKPAFTDRFRAYFDREVARKAAQSLKSSAEIEIRVGSETFTFMRKDGRNGVQAGPARKPQVIFALTPAAAEEILNHPSEDVGAIGVAILKLLVSQDADRKATFSLKAGFLTLFNQGYLGVLSAGGGSVAAFLASRGLNGMSAIKKVLKGNP